MLHCFFPQLKKIFSRQKVLFLCIVCHEKTPTTPHYVTRSSRMAQLLTGRRKSPYSYATLPRAECNDLPAEAYHRCGSSGQIAFIEEAGRWSSRGNVLLQGERTKAVSRG